MTPGEKLAAILADLKEKQVNAAKRNKPTMWAYYLQMRRGLCRWFTATTDGGIAGQALALVQFAQRRTSERADIAARWWALGVYANRILATWRGGPTPELNRSLDWLRERAEEG